MVKKGDTLIEVMLAVGIFSMIAIAITAVMSGGTSEAQTALETTLAREEIDTQAEALRFIQSSYITDKDSSDKKYTKLWKAITDVEPLPNDPVLAESYIQYMPSTCAELYDSASASSIVSQKAFIINPRALGTFTEESIDSVYISINGDNSNKFSQATIYPRLVYGNSSSDNETGENLTSNKRYNNLYKAEGIYVIAVRDSDTTKIIKDDKNPEKEPAFYDFYIRTCWYGSNAKDPSTISTVIRLYDPDAIKSSGE